MGSRGKHLPWDQPDATPYEDIQDWIREFHSQERMTNWRAAGGDPEARAFLQEMIDTDPALQARLAEWQEHYMRSVIYGESTYVESLKAWDAQHDGPVLGNAAHLYATDEMADWSAMDRHTNGAWLEFTTEPFERI